MRLYVCLSVRKHIDRSSRNFVCRSPVTVAQSSSGGVALRYVLQVLWMTPRLAVMGGTPARVGSIQRRRSITCATGAESDVYVNACWCFATDTCCKTRERFVFLSKITAASLSAAAAIFYRRLCWWCFSAWSTWFDCGQPDVAVNTWASMDDFGLLASQYPSSVSVLGACFFSSIKLIIFNDVALHSDDLIISAASP